MGWEKGVGAEEWEVVCGVDRADNGCTRGYRVGDIRAEGCSIRGLGEGRLLWGKTGLKVASLRAIGGGGWQW